jgi:hypothetical protein
MIPVSVAYVYFSAGPHQRQPRSGSGGFVNLVNPNTGSSTTGDILPQVYAPDPWPNTAYRLSFWNVSGGSISPGGPPTPVTVYNTSLVPAAVASPAGIYVGEVPITLLAVYAPTGQTGPPGGPSGATIDQLDISTSQLIDDTFVTVAPDASGSLTNSGNVEGYVDTTHSYEDITALPTTSPTDVDFVGWAILGPPAALNTSPTLAVAQGVSVLALALYQAPPLTNLGTISGTVTFDSDGGIYPLSVLVTAFPGGTTQSDGGDGTYTLTNLEPGTVQVKAQINSIGRRFYAPSVEENTVTVVAGETVTLDFQFVRRGTIF